jgi:hypothetical protein
MMIKHITDSVAAAQLLAWARAEPERAIRFAWLDSKLASSNELFKYLPLSYFSRILA